MKRRILAWMLALALLVAAFPVAALAADDAEQKTIDVYVTVEKLTLGQGFLVEPEKVTVPEGTTAAKVLTDLLTAHHLDYKNTGKVESSFYLSEVADPDRGTLEDLNVPQYILDVAGELREDRSPDWLGEFDYTSSSGWMYSVNGSFPNVGASDRTLEDGDVMRWQFTLHGYGADLDADNSAWGGVSLKKLADKAALIKAVADIASDGQQGLYGETYTNALQTLAKLDATQEEVDAALANLQPNDPAEGFTDLVKDSWYYTSVQFAVSRGLFSGTSETTFEPESSMTRAMIAAVLWRMAGRPEPKQTSGFQDVVAGSWYADAVSWAKEEGLVFGITEDTFGPMEQMTREQFAALIYRYAKYQGCDVTAQADLASFQDQGAVSKYAQTAIRWAVAENIMAGMKVDGQMMLCPRSDVTRAQSAMLLMKLYQNVLEAK